MKAWEIKQRYRNRDKRLSREFGQRLKAIRKSRHLTQKQLAKRIPVSIATMRRYEEGVNAKRPKDSTVDDIADSLGVTTEELFGID